MKRFGFILIIILVITVIYARYFGINEFKIHEETVSVNGVPSSFDGLKIVHFSDILFNEYYSIDKLNTLVQKINSLEPDLIFFTGDLIDDSYNISVSKTDEIITSLSKLDATMYKYSIYGDNDLENKDTYKSIMDESDFILLDNKTTYLFYEDNTPISITGLTTTSSLDMSYALEDDIVPAYNITLLHKPDLVSNVINKANLVFSGHSLGGYIDPLLFSPLLKKEDAKIYTNGYYELENTKVYVSNGLGVEDTPYRLFNSPSINLIRLKTTD